MGEQASSHISPAIVLLAVGAVAFSGAGGLVSGEKVRMLLGAGAGFCLIMLLVTWIMLSARSWSEWAHCGLSAANGALCGLCYGLYFGVGAGWASPLVNATAGAGLGFLSFWAWRLKHPARWRDDR